MIELSGTAFLLVKALHIISVISWMAGMLYLPRLFVYHCDAEPGSDKSETFKIMERRLLRAIINPAMVLALIFGVIMLLSYDSSAFRDGWLHTKLLALVGLFAMHGMMSRWRKDFAEDRNQKSQKFFRYMNEIPTVLMIVIVIMAVVKPF